MNKKELYAAREEFFNNVVELINRSPTKMDVVLQQAQYYVKPLSNRTIIDSESGDLAICVESEFFKYKFTVWYSMWQLGELLKIGIGLNDSNLQASLNNDSYHEINYMWGKDNMPRFDVAHGTSVLCEWDFLVPKLYDSYKEQERFIFGFRHMHYRVMRTMHDECKKIMISNEEYKETLGIDNAIHS